MGKEVFDYENNVISEHDILYYGFHRHDGKISIDTQRLKKVFDAYGRQVHDYFGVADILNYPRNTHYFIPQKKHRSDYFVNYLVDTLRGLLQDWKEEFEPMIKSIKTPGDVEADAITSKIAFTASSDDYDDIFEFAKLKSAFRLSKYNELVKSFCVQYIQKVYAEYLRVMFFVLSKNGYQNTEDLVSLTDVIRFVTKKFLGKPVKKNPFYQLETYKYFIAISLVSNFTKHNSAKCYLDLLNNSFEKNEDAKKYYKSFVYENKERKFKNGDYALSWVNVNPDRVLELIEGLIDFSYEYCELVFDESPFDSMWNYDDYLLNCINRFIKEEIDGDVDWV